MTAPDPIIVSAFGTGFVACGTAITIMWRKLSRDHLLLQDRADRCEEDRETMHDEIGELKGKVSMLENCPSRACPYGRPDSRGARPFASLTSGSPTSKQASNQPHHPQHP